MNVTTYLLLGLGMAVAVVALALLTEWANMLDAAKQGAKVVQLRKVG